MKSGKKRLMQFLMLCGLLGIFMMQTQAAAKTVQSGRDSNGTSVTKTQNYEEFAKATAALVKANQGNYDARAASKNRFFAKRLIVKSNGKSLDFSKLNATAAVKGPNGLYVVQFASVAAAENAMRTIESWSGIKYVEPDSLSHAGGEKTARVEGTIPENDLALNGEWSLGEDSRDEDTNSLMSGLAGVSESLAAGNTALMDSVKFNSWGVEWIGADSYAKNVAARTSSSIKVAVVDSGVDQTHPFLESRVTSDGYDFVDVDSNPYDEFGHGTHVSGIIVDCTPGVKVKILPVRVLGADGNGWNSVISSGIYYAVERGAKVINMSLNGDCTQDEEDAIDYAVQKGVTVVVSAGNKNEDVVKTYNCPAHKKNVICVGAIDLRNVKADFSNYGSTLDVVAPGVGIYSCVPGGYYESWDGTSMATPHVAALAAMVKLVHPSYSPAQVEKTIKAHCKDLGPKGYDVKYGYGVPQFASVDRVIDVKSVTLNKTSVTVKAGQKYTLKATVSPSNATNKTITWRSANPSVATVSGGVVTAKKAGTGPLCDADRRRDPRMPEHRHDHSEEREWKAGHLQSEGDIGCKTCSADPYARIHEPGRKTQSWLERSKWSERLPGKLLQLWNGYNEHKIFKRKDQYRVDDHAEQKRALPYFCLRIPDRVRSAGLRGNKTCLRFRTENHSGSKCDQYGDHLKVGEAERNQWILYLPVGQP